MFLHGKQLEDAAETQSVGTPAQVPTICLARLTQVQALIVRMTLAGFTQSEIATVRRCSERSIRYVLESARKRLRNSPTS